MVGGNSCDFPTFGIIFTQMTFNGTSLSLEHFAEVPFTPWCNIWGLSCAV